MRRFAGRGVEREDLFQQGVLGLLKAKNTYDISRGTRFSTWAVPIILGQMRSICDKAPFVHIPRTDREKWRLMLMAGDKLRRSLGREPTAGELCGELRVAPSEFVQLMSVGDIHSLPIESCEAPLAQPCFEDALLLKETLCHLPKPMPRLLRLRYNKRLTQQQTARVLGMSQSAVSKLEKKAAAQLKEMLIQG